MKNMSEIKEGTKLRCISEVKDLTPRNIYIIESVDDETFCIIDDVNELHTFSICYFNLYFKFAKSKKDPIVKQVTDKFKQRSKVGIEKYGTTLAENNTDDFLEHLQQELMDATLYIQKLKEQSRSKEISENILKGTSYLLKNSSSEQLLIELQSRGLCLNYSIHK
jgi:hypothetical protein